MKKNLILLGAIMITLISYVPISQACEYEEGDAPRSPSVEERFELVDDVVVARITEHSYEGHAENLAFQVEKVYKGNLEVGAKLNLRHWVEGSAACGDDDYLYGDRTDWWEVTSYDTPAYLLLINEENELIGFNQAKAKFADDGDVPQLALHTAIEYADDLLVDLVDAQPGLLEQADTPTSSIAALQDQIKQLLQIVELLTQLVALQAST